MTGGMRIVFMGVCGSGKTTMAARAAAYLGCEPVLEADVFHSSEMKEKMRAGIPLCDEDRWPWLQRINRAMRESPSPCVVVTCSALRRTYRARLAEGLENRIHFIFLDAPASVIQERLSCRVHEYMPPSLLGSQFEVLERPEAGEPVTTVMVTGSEGDTFEEIKRLLNQLRQAAS